MHAHTVSSNKTRVFARLIAKYAIKAEYKSRSWGQRSYAVKEVSLKFLLICNNWRWFVQIKYTFNASAAKRIHIHTYTANSHSNFFSHKSTNRQLIKQPARQSVSQAALRQHLLATCNMKPHYGLAGHTHTHLYYIYLYSATKPWSFIQHSKLSFLHSFIHSIIRSFICSNHAFRQAAAAISIH